MAKGKSEKGSTKTNAMRILEQAGIPYEVREYTYDEDHLGGDHVVAQLGEDPDTVFKTLVARGEKKGIMVFCIPVNEELDLKKAAQAAGDKRIEMVHVKELFGLTGYIRGGCSPVGMKKKYPTFIEETALLFDEIFLSGGARGVQIEVNPEQLISFLEAEPCEVVKG